MSLHHLPSAEAGGPADEPRPASRLVRSLDGLASVLMAVSGTMMVALIAIFGWLVFGRYVLNDTPTWVEQASLVLIVWITFLGSAVGVWRSSPLSIDFLREAMPAGPREVLRILADAGLVVFGATMAWYGGVLVLNTSRRTITMLGISEGWRAVPLSLCGALIVLFAAVRLGHRLAPLFRKHG